MPSDSKVTQLPTDRDVQTITPEDVGSVDSLEAAPPDALDSLFDTLSVDPDLIANNGLPLEPKPAATVVRTSEVDKIVSEAINREAGQVLNYLFDCGFLKEGGLTAAHGALTAGNHRK